MAKNYQNRAPVTQLLGTLDNKDDEQAASGASGEVTETAPEFQPMATSFNSTSNQIEVTRSSSAQAQKPYFEALVEKIQASGSESEKRVLVTLQNYMSRMKPGMPVNESEGAQAQFVLWNLFITVIERTTENFNDSLAIILAFFDKFKDGVFNERYALRFMEHVKLDASQRTSFAALINLFRLTADPQSRKAALAQVDLKRTLDKNFSEKGRQRVIQFFTR